MTCSICNGTGKILMLFETVDCECQTANAVGPRWDGKTLRDPRSMNAALGVWGQQHKIGNEEDLLKAFGPFKYGRILKTGITEIYGDVIRQNGHGSNFSFVSHETYKDIMPVRSVMFMGSRWYGIDSSINTAFTRFSELCCIIPVAGSTANSIDGKFPLQEKEPVDDIGRSIVEAPILQPEVVTQMVLQGMVGSILKKFGNIRNWCRPLQPYPETDCSISKVIDYEGLRFRITHIFLHSGDVEISLEVGI